MGAHSSLTTNAILLAIMRCDVTNYVRTCDPCQKIKHNRGAGMGYLQPLVIPGKPFNTISLDFITRLPLLNRKDTILVLVDKLTKFAHFIATTSNINAGDTAILIFKHVVKVFRLPEVIVRDRDPRWISSVWKNLAVILNSCLALSTSKHPQMDRQTEVMNQQLETMLRAYSMPIRRIGPIGLMYYSWLTIIPPIPHIRRPLLNCCWGLSHVPHQTFCMRADWNSWMVSWNFIEG